MSGTEHPPDPPLAATVADAMAVRERALRDHIRTVLRQIATRRTKLIVDR